MIPAMSGGWLRPSTAASFERKTQALTRGTGGLPKGITVAGRAGPGRVDGLVAERHAAPRRASAL